MNFENFLQWAVFDLNWTLKLQLLHSEIFASHYFWKQVELKAIIWTFFKTNDFKVQFTQKLQCLFQKFFQPSGFEVKLTQRYNLHMKKFSKWLISISKFDFEGTTSMSDFKVKIQFWIYHRYLTHIYFYLLFLSAEQPLFIKSANQNIKKSYCFLKNFVDLTTTKSSNYSDINSRQLP